MDYKKVLIDLIESIDSESILKYLYEFTKSFITKYK